MDLSGNWSYNEDFEYGKSKGEVTLLQTGTCVEGCFTFTEMVEGDYKIEVKENVKGEISDNILILKSTEVVATQNGKNIDYLPNTFEIQMLSEQKLVGATYDSEMVCGVFVLNKKPAQSL